EAGLRGAASTALSLGRVARAFGLRGLRDYIAGTQRGVRRPGREKVAELVEAIAAGGAAKARPLVTAEATIQVADTAPQPLLALLGEAPLALSARDLRASGYTVSGRIEFTRGGARRQGLAFFDFH